VYDDIADATGRAIKTAAAVQVEVADLIEQLGTSRAFASRIAVEYAAPGKTGNVLHARLEQEVATLPLRTFALAGAKPGRAAMDAAAEVVDAEAHLFSMRDRTKPGIDVMGEVQGGELAFIVRAVLKGSGARGTLSGSYMFERMLEHFRSQGTTIDVIQGSWTYESNLDLFNRLSRIGLIHEEAAAGTITGEWAARQGYTRVTNVVVEPSNVPPGAYTRVTAQFQQ
jgi:hypothetical protein